MTRHVLTVDLKDDPAVIEAYREHHRRVWPEVLAQPARRRASIDMQIYLLGRRLVMVVDLQDGLDVRRAFARPRRLAPARRRVGSADEVAAAAAARRRRRASGGPRWSRSSISMNDARA